MKTARDLSATLMVVAIVAVVVGLLVGLVAVPFTTGPDFLIVVVNAMLWYGTCTAIVSGVVALALTVFTPSTATATELRSAKLQPLADLSAGVFCLAALAIVFALVLAPFSIMSEHAWLNPPISFTLYYGFWTALISAAAWCILKFALPAQAIECECSHTSN